MPAVSENSMKVKRDEDLPLKIAVELRARTHEVQAVGEELLTGRVDADIWQAAQREGRVLITQDLDFSDTRKFVPGTHHGIVLDVHVGLNGLNENLICQLASLWVGQNGLHFAEPQRT